MISRRLFLVILGTLWVSLGWGQTVEFGVSTITDPQRFTINGGAVAFGGYDRVGPLCYGGSGGILVSDVLALGVGSALVGLRPVRFLILWGRVGLGGGIYQGQAGATYQMGGEVAFSISDSLVLALSGDRFWNLNSIPALGEGRWVGGIGLRFRIPVDPHS